MKRTANKAVMPKEQFVYELRTMNHEPPVIVFDHVSKRYLKQRMRYRLLSESLALWTSRVFRRKQTNNHNVIKALDSASFHVSTGETLGIIGNNGAGKSTILKLIARITSPDQGKVESRGKIGALIELGAGLHPELTGRENIYLYGAILGMKRSEVEHRFPDIVSFAELEEFLDLPIKRYSSGMYARLGFSVAVNMDPDILLIDEVLAVGDEAFQEKCFKKMREIKRRTTTIIFISHNMEWVQKICTRVIFLDHGHIIADGPPAGTIATYRRYERTR